MFHILLQAAKVQKTASQSDVIRKGLASNVFLKNFDHSQVNQLIDCMQLTKLSANENIIQEGDAGNELYILEKGQVSEKRSLNFIISVELFNW